MGVVEVIGILLLALLLAWLFAVPLGRPGPWGGFWWFFLVLFLGTWAVAAWAEPAGPRAWGVAWAPIVVGALIIALLLAAIPPRTPLPPEAEPTYEVVAVSAGAIGAFFWLMIIGLMVVIALGMLAAVA